jgi:hypothetical protein
MHIFNIILNVLVLALWLFIFNYIISLEKIGCECSKSWQRDYIKYFIIVIMIMLILSTFEIFSFKTTHPVIVGLYFIATIAFIIITYYYIQKLKVEKCECSAHVARDVLEIVNYIQMFLIALAFILMIYFMFTISQVAPKLATSAKKSVRKSS